MKTLLIENQIYTAIFGDKGIDFTFTGKPGEEHEFIQMIINHFDAEGLVLNLGNEDYEEGNFDWLSLYHNEIGFLEPEVVWMESSWLDDYVVLYPKDDTVWIQDI